MDKRAIVNSEATAKYLRVASMSIALYDYILTLPSEYRLYRSQTSIMHLSLACILFILIRYSSILVIILSNYGAFATTFTAESCRRYFLVPPIFKAVQTLVSQTILGVRTFNIARRANWVGLVMLIFFMVTTSAAWFTNLYHRIPVTNNGNCTAANDPNHRIAWLFYLFAMIYDLTTLLISTIYLLQCVPQAGRFSQLITVMLYDGLGYFVVLTAVNVFNLILYKTSTAAIQSSGASLGYALTWIMSQRILIHLRDLSTSFGGGRMGSVIVSRQLQSTKDISQAIRSQFDSSKGPIDQDFRPRSTEGDVELDVQVRVEQSVKMDYDEAYERDPLAKPKSLWYPDRQA